MAVFRAIRSGRLRASIARDAHGKPKVADVALADVEWTSSTDPSKAPGYEVKTPTNGRGTVTPFRARANVPSPLAEAATREKGWRARLIELTYREKAGELIEVDVARRDFINVATAVKARLRAIPDAVAEQLIAAARTGPAAVKALLLAKIDDALRELARGPQCLARGVTTPDSLTERKKEP